MDLALHLRHVAEHEAPFEDESPFEIVSEPAEPRTRRPGAEREDDARPSRYAVYRGGRRLVWGLTSEEAAERWTYRLSGIALPGGRLPSSARERAERRAARPGGAPERRTV